MKDVMRDYAMALGIGVSAGIIYGLLRFRSPAPPVIALAGLLGMLIGEHVVGLARARFWPDVQVAPCEESSQGEAKAG
jgi:XapX domain-containing protein